MTEAYEVYRSLMVHIESLKRKVSKLEEDVQFLKNIIKKKSALDLYQKASEVGEQLDGIKQEIAHDISQNS